MKKLNTYFSLISISLLILLWLYAALSKLFDFAHFQRQMEIQVFPLTIARLLVWVIPAYEFLLAGLLLFPKNKAPGLWGSFCLMGAFTVYIMLILTRVFERVPCSCGGILQRMGWTTHFIFNLAWLLLIGLTLLFMDEKKGGAVTKS